MTRIVAAAALLCVLAMPAFACEWNKSAETDTPQTSTVASQPSSDHAAPQATKAADSHKPS